MEPYKDPDEFIKNLGAEAFEERIQKARNGFMFSLEILERDYDMTSPEGRTDFMKEAARKLTEFDEEIERNNYIDAVAGTYHVSSEDLKNWSDEWQFRPDLQSRWKDRDLQGVRTWIRKMVHESHRRFC